MVVGGEFMKTILLKILFALLPVMFGTMGCVGVKTFTTAARAGDTVALAVGWQKNLQRQNVTVTIKDNIGGTTIYYPNDSHVRAIANMYPDPVSRVVVGTMTNQSLGYGGNYTGGQINSYVTKDSVTGETDNDWWQTTMMLDLPSTMAQGLATISIADTGGSMIQSISVNILSGTGGPNNFSAYMWPGDSVDIAPLTSWWPDTLHAMERADRFTVTFSSYKDAGGHYVIPHSIQVQFTHTPGVGQPWVVNPRGDIKNAIWNDDGTNITVILIPTQGKTLSQMLDFKFYIAGGITGLTQPNLKAYDVNGNLMSGITATVQ
jgi:hypothetical protein